MKIKRFLIVFLIFILLFTKISQVKAIPISNTFKQGIYDLSDYIGYYTTIKLATPNKPITYIVVGPYGRIKYSARFEKGNELLTEGPIEKGDTAVILGTGEVVIIPIKI